MTLTFLQFFPLRDVLFESITALFDVFSLFLYVLIVDVTPVMWLSGM